MKSTVTRRLDFSKLNFSGRFISTEEALKDIESFNTTKQRIDEYAKSSARM